MQGTIKAITRLYQKFSMTSPIETTFVNLIPIAEVPQIYFIRGTYQAYFVMVPMDKLSFGKGVLLSGSTPAFIETQVKNGVIQAKLSEGQMTQVSIYYYI